MEVLAKEKPRWYQLRWKLSNLFMCIGRWIYPKNPEWQAFLMQLTLDQMLYGGAMVRIDPFAERDVVSDGK